MANKDDWRLMGQGTLSAVGSLVLEDLLPLERSENGALFANLNVHHYHGAETTHSEPMFRALLNEGDAGVLSITTRLTRSEGLGVVTTFVSSEAVAVILPGLPSPGFCAHQEVPSSAAQRSLRHASAPTESLSTSSPAEGRSRTSPTACPA